MASAFFRVSESAARYSSTKRFSVAVTWMVDFEVDDEEDAELDLPACDVPREVFGMASKSDFCVTPQAFAMSLTT